MRYRIIEATNEFRCSTFECVTTEKAGDGTVRSAKAMTPPPWLQKHLFNLRHAHGGEDVAGCVAESHEVSIPRRWTVFNRADVSGGQPNARCRIRNGVPIRRAEDERIVARPADEDLASITRRPEIHVVSRSAEHDVAVGGAAGYCL